MRIGVKLELSCDGQGREVRHVVGRPGLVLVGE